MPNTARNHWDNVFCMLYRDRGNLLSLYNAVNGNMPLRDLYYVAEELKRLVPVSRLYRRTRVKIPSPRFVVFYNGVEEQPAETVLRLSDLYENGTGEPELTVRQININKGCNDSILEKCESLRGYVAFVEKVREKERRQPKLQTWKNGNEPAIGVENAKKWPCQG